MRTRTLLAALAVTCAAGLSAANFPDPPKEVSAPAGKAAIVLAGGCFWGMEGVFEHVKGVKAVTSGYAGGSAADATYDQVSNETTRHAEAIRIVYNPADVSYGTLLRVYFSVAHNPTELNRQGPDVGTQYRSAIFYTDDQQKKLAESSKAAVIKTKNFGSTIATEITAATTFYPAEDYHQNYYLKNPIRYKFYRFNCGRDARLRASTPGSTCRR